MSGLGDLQFQPINDVFALSFTAGLLTLRPPLVADVVVAQLVWAFLGEDIIKA